MTIYPSSNRTPTSRDQRAEPLVLSVREAAALLGISKDLAYELVRTGELPALRLGRRVVVPKARLLALVSGTSPVPRAADLPTVFARPDVKERAP